MSTTRTQRATRDDRLDRVFGALSDRTRRALLAHLGRAPAKITDLARPFDMTLPAVSKHLRVLERAGLVQRTIEGREHWCALDAAALADAERWLTRNRAFWEETLDGLARYVAKDKK